MLIKKLKNYNVILASKSLRRQQLLKDAGINFRQINDRETDEAIPGHLNKFEIPLFLSEKKSDAYSDILTPDTIMITADTIVWFEGKVLGKPKNRTEAFKTLKQLSGQTHEVITGVTIRSTEKKKSFYSYTEVVFADLNHDEIAFYIDNYKPYDKAGSYGIQEWIGYIGIKEIHGSFFNVMGLPIHKLYRELEQFITNT